MIAFYFTIFNTEILRSSEISNSQNCLFQDRSEEDDGLQSDYSFEEDEGLDESNRESSKEANKSEQLENAENQKLSTEKMTANSLHRLHVDFDDLSVVDEEEEPKREKDKKDIHSEDAQQPKEGKSPPSILKSRLLHENIPFYPGAYQPPTCRSSPTYYTDCPFKFPSTLNLMMASDTSGMLSTPCTRLNADPLVAVPSLGVLNVDQVSDHILHPPPVGWQSNIMLPQGQIPTSGPAEIHGPSGIHQDQVRQQPVASTTGGFPIFPRFLQSRNTGLKQTINPSNSSIYGNTFRSGEKTVVGNGWPVHANSTTLKGTKDQQSSIDLKERAAQGSPALPGAEKPKHFFAPLPSKLKKQSDESSPTASHFGTGNSSSSGKTGSTVVCKNQFSIRKGSADVYVNGAVPLEDHFQRDKTEQRTFFSTENLLITEDKSSNSSNPLMKSMSCQDLSSEPQSVSINHGDARQQLLTQSDNTLDNKSDTKPFKSHLSVTLKTPRTKQPVSPDTPEIPKLPSIDYKLFKNPFLRTFDPSASYMDQNNVTRPLSVQINDDSLCYCPPQPEVSGFNRTVPFGDRYRTIQTDQNRLLIPSTQLTNGKVVPPTGKHQIQVTSFERPSPHTLIGPSSPYDFNTLRRLNTNPYLQNQNLYQNVSILPRGAMYPQRGMMFYENLATKVPAQTQTSIDGDSHHEDEHTLSHEESAPNTPSGQRRKRAIRKEKGNATKDQKQLSPAAQRRLKKQISATSSEVPESPEKGPRKKPRRLSITTTTTSEGQEDKNESRSSSSGRDSPKKDQIRRVSLYFNAKKRPSLSSVKTAGSGSLDISREKDAMLMNLERERTNSVSSRETGSAKARKASTSSGNVPWCACWGNGCI